MLHNDLTADLDNALQSISQLLVTLTPDDWQRPQDEKWTIAQEFDHLRLSTQGTAFILSSAGRSRWHPFAGESRSFGTIAAQYQTALAANPGIDNPATRPTNGTHQSLAEQRVAWNNLAGMLTGAAAELPEADFDAYTVWKHPLLGPLTVREMLYFTTCHTAHHDRIMTKKRAMAT